MTEEFLDLRDVRDWGINHNRTARKIGDKIRQEGKKFVDKSEDLAEDIDDFMKRM